MAGDWIKVEKATASKPELLRIASELKCSVGDAFFHCFRFWAWCDDQLKDGNAVGVTETMLDALLGRDGLCAALIKVDWLQVRSGSLVVPHFDRHLSESAKKRSLSGKRQAVFKATKGNAKGNAEVTQEALPEKRREEYLGGDDKSSSGSSFSKNGISAERAISGAGRKKKTRPDFNAANVLLPASLGRHEGFRQAWLEWCAYRSGKRKPISERACQGQLDDLAAVGPESAIAAIRKAIKSDWQGLFPEREAASQSHAGLKAWAANQEDLDQ